MTLRHPFPYSLLLFSFLILLQCTTRQPEVQGAPDGVLVLSPQPEKMHQTIHNFGASDAWSCQFVGKNWPLAKREAIADLLFSTALKPDGSPAGIGLTAWRFNIGGGSAAQGEASDIRDEWRRADGFLQPDGTMDLTAQPGQRWFLRAARERGVKTFTGFVNSPPVSLTKNGKAYSTGGNSANLSPENYPAYVQFLTDVIAGLHSTENIQLDYISPFNEPQWDWNEPNQEGSPWKNEEIATVSRMLNQQLVAKALNTRIEIPETAQIDYLYRTHNRPDRGDQIEVFFREGSENYLGDLQQLAPKVAGHSYFSTWDLNKLIDQRQTLAAKLREFPELEYWMSEYTLLENNPEVKGGGRDLGIEPALYMARVIHADLTVAGAAAWQWWLAVSPYNYKDGLVYIDHDKNDGAVYPSKMLWALGNYARFIRPGMVRIGLDRSDQLSVDATLDRAMVSAYLDPETGKTVVVAINYSQEEIPVQLATRHRSAKYKCYRTSAVKDLQLLGEFKSGDTQRLPPRSITTLVEL
ncbi:glycoside hydrolase [Flavilitoribacter nigricans]|uniref:Xylanase n=1 Tax=Flavilitoribacter nigricans (strain ATCC 23147 / DSM 23189 / NBRC 102662 / NCIMB 1420 / SS-2) TaxID=1122177 RepID=A0A2D0NDP2_FLAN2|nr:glycoside hydrolase [Flavilitoribacter nigricans]PHN06612.1 xylanase [Flavilitoribacter nigricans DSM 23189 = NBRC 102662]